MNIKQREDEMLRSYITYFNKEALLIDEVVGTYVIHLLGTYVTILRNWLIF